jgi:uncharacterized membrane protein (UPF0127 family)
MVRRLRPRGFALRILLALVAVFASVAMAAAPPACAQAMGSGLRSPAAEPNRGLAIVPVTLETAKGPKTYRVEIARTAAEQATGMMYRTEVPAGTGMLFPMAPSRPAAFWMRNTWVPLDIIFIGADSRVRNIEANAVPLSEALRASNGPVAAVLELAGGEAARIGLMPGDRVLVGGKPLGATAPGR